VIILNETNAAIINLWNKTGNGKFKVKFSDKRDRTKKCRWIVYCGLRCCVDTIHEYLHSMLTVLNDCDLPVIDCLAGLVLERSQNDSPIFKMVTGFSDLGPMVFINTYKEGLKGFQEIKVKNFSSKKGALESLDSTSINAESGLWWVKDASVFFTSGKVLAEDKNTNPIKAKLRKTTRPNKIVQLVRSTDNMQPDIVSNVTTPSIRPDKLHQFGNPNCSVISVYKKPVLRQSSSYGGMYIKKNIYPKTGDSAHPNFVHINERDSRTASVQPSIGNKINNDSKFVAHNNDKNKNLYLKNQWLIDLRPGQRRGLENKAKGRSALQLLELCFDVKASKTFLN
jgi:hypothetical protein